MARRYGMTLIEVMLAIGVSAAVIGGAMAFYHHAMNVREGLTERVRSVEANRRVMDLITRELRAAKAHPFVQMGVEGEADTISFVFASLPGGEAWSLADREDEPIPPVHDLTIVEYRLRYTEDDETGEMVIDGLGNCVLRDVYAVQIPTLEGEEEQKEDEQPEPQGTLISPYAKFLRFRYWYDGNWLESWTGGDLPKAVEITLGFDPISEGAEVEDYDSEALRRVVFLPGAIESTRPGGNGLQPEPEPEDQ